LLHRLEQTDSAKPSSWSLMDSDATTSAVAFLLTYLTEIKTRGVNCKVNTHFKQKWKLDINLVKNIFIHLIPCAKNLRNFGFQANFRPKVITLSGYYRSKKLAWDTHSIKCGELPVLGLQFFGPIMPYGSALVLVTNFMR
jgi:hypothetical protein